MRLGKKGLISILLGFWPITKLMALLNNIRPQNIIILAYHRVYDIQDDNAFKYDKDLVSASCAQFEWQIKYIKKNFNAITFHELDKYLSTNSKIPKNTVIITFDDGYMDNYINAYKILKENNVNAVFFISTQYIDSNELFWFDKIAYYLKQTNKSEIRLGEFNLVLDLSTYTNVDNSIKKVLRLCKSISNENRERLIDILIKECSVDEEVHNIENLPMTWECVKEISDSGYEIGSHTKTHAILSQLSTEHLKNELIESKTLIEYKTGKPVISIAYPVGGASAFNDKVCEEAKAAGYIYGCTYIAGENEIKDINKYRLRRSHIETYTSKNYFKSILLMPSIFG